jgi:hypothetical protein
MNARFVAAMEQAFRRGQECRESACAEFCGVRKGSAARAWQLGQLLHAPLPAD